MLIAKQIMTRDPYTVTPETAVRDLAEKLTENNYSGAPVLDEGGALIGVVTVSDLIFQKKKLHLPTVFTLFDSVVTLGAPYEVDDQIKKMLGSTVSEIMSRDAITVDEDAQLEDIATIMSEQGRHFIPVVKDGLLAGVIDRSDVMKAIVKGA
ncbi:MAG TPA: CBS domain-containing protein [Nitrospirae bacterium]|nr:CBS domain-containing protein [Nitrospirota bacterium]